MSVVDVDVPDGPGELVAVRSASICSSDFKYIAHGSTSIIGHELAGVTEDGRAVAIEAIFGCGECDLCREGRYNLCPTTGREQLGFGVDGGMSEWFRVPSRALVELPAGVDPANACLVEPLAVSWHGCVLAGVGEGMRVAVVGGGAVGLMAVAAARGLGAGEVSLEARYPHQIERGERLGATAPSGRYDVVMEAAGTASSLHRATQLVERGGAMGVLGVFDPGTEWPYWSWLMKEVRTFPAVGYGRHEHGRDVDDAARLLAANPDLVDTLITHRFPIEDAPEAFRVAADKATGAVRVVVEPSPA
ncbi:MAG TPA: alcohol dehydrogenase catalytic domain-containing protein [Acidimicrobiales bacterium]